MDITNNVATKEVVIMTNEEFQKFIIENMATKADMDEIRQSLARIENDYGDKLESLYDAREVSLDQNERISQSLLRIESKLEKMSLKINSHEATLRRAK